MPKPNFLIFMMNTNHLKFAKRDVIDRLKAWGLMRDVIGQRRFS